MRRGMMVFVLAMLVLVSGAAARGAAAEEMQLDLPIDSGLEDGPVPHGSLTVNVLKCNPGMTIVTLDPAGCTADNTDVQFALWDVEQQQDIPQIQAIDNGDGSFTWGGLLIEDPIDGQGDGDFVGVYELSLVAPPAGAVNWAGFGDYDQNTGQTSIDTDYPAAWIDFYFFFPEEGHDPGDWIDNGDDGGIDELAGVVSVNAYLCPADVMALNPDDWAGACVDPLDGLSFTLTHLDSPYLETRVTGDDGIGNAFFAALGKGTYHLTVELFEGMLLGDGICDQPNQSGEAGVYGLGVEPGVATYCNYYIVPEAQDGIDELAGLISVNAYLCAPGFQGANPDEWAANCPKPLDGVAFTLNHLDSPYVGARTTGDDGFGVALFPALGKGTYELTFQLLEGMIFGDGFCDQPNQSGVEGVYGLGVEPGVATFCIYYITLDPQDGEAPVDEPVDEDEGDDDDEEMEELGSVTSLPDTGTGSTATGGTSQTAAVAAVVLLIGFAAMAGALRRTFNR